MRKLLLTGVVLAGVASPALADTMIHNEWGYQVQPSGTIGPEYLISCEVLGATNKTQGRPGYMTMAIEWAPGLVKPTPGWCLQGLPVGYPKPPPVRIDPNWPINLGKISNVIGVRCTIADDDMSFSCDWPPYEK